MSPPHPTMRGILTTSAGLVIVYTVSEGAGRFVHHCSVSMIGTPTTHAVGGTLTLFVAKLLALPLPQLRFEVAESTVHHAELSVDAERHAALAAIPVLDLASADLAALRRQALETRASIAWQRMPAGLEQDGAR